MPDAPPLATTGAPAPGAPAFAAPVRSALLSIYQSAALEHPGPDGRFGYAVSRVAAARLGQETVPVDAPAGIADDIWSCARLGLAWLEAHVTGDAAAARLHDTLKGSDCDPRWIETLERHLVYFGTDGHRRAVPYRRPAMVGDQALPLKSDARIALISDWGLGTEAADQVLRQAVALRPDVLIHLGDVYYSGTAREYELNFRKPIAARLGEDGSRIPVYILSGNHDMYSGGHAYYAMIDRLNPEPLRQRASWFCLRSADQAWQVLAIDTGLHDHDPLTAVGSAVQTFVEPEEVAWHAARIREFPGRSILLSHHPLFSAFQQLRPREPDGSLLPVNQSLLDGFAPLLAEGRIAAWFWGHEHALAIYQPFAGLTRGRCVGNGAIPVAISDDPYRSPDRLLDRPGLLPGVTPGRNGPLYAHGCALLDLGAGARVEFYQTMQSTPLYGERLDDGTPPGPVGPDIASTNISSGDRTMKTFGKAIWHGGFKDGKGAISTKSGALSSYTYGVAARFEGKPGTNPEELIGAAHAGCFTMALSLILGEANLTAEQMETQADVTLDKVEDGYAITAIHLTLHAKIPGVDQATFEALAGKAKAGCPVSKLLHANITMDATLTA